MEPKTQLRPLADSDLDAVFEMMADPAAVHMAAFTTSDPTNRAAFDDHMSKILAEPANDCRAIADDAGRFVGTIATFPSDDGSPEVTYWIRRQRWRQGHASRALTRMLAESSRPVVARVAADNLGSLQVLLNAGFVVHARNVDYAPGRQAEVEEIILRLA